MKTRAGDHIFDGLMDAHLNEAYYRCRAERSARADLLLRLLAAVAAGTAIAASLAEPDALYLAGLVFGVAAVLPAVVLASRLAERSRQWGDLAAKWTGIVRDWRLLDLNRGEGQQAAKVDVVLVRVEELRAQDTTKRRTRLVSRLYDEVVRPFERASGC